MKTNLLYLLKAKILEQTLLFHLTLLSHISERYKHSIINERYKESLHALHVHISLSVYIENDLINGGWDLINSEWGLFCFSASRLHRANWGGGGGGGGCKRGLIEEIQ